MNVQEAHRWLVRELLLQEEEGEARSLARIVLEDGFGVKDLQSTDNLHPDTQLKLNNILQRLRLGQPVQYILGTAHFYGYDFRVSPAVLIPRPETEELVQLLLKKEKWRKGLRLLDVGTGSGCIAITIKKERPDLQCWAVDISADALLLAEGNAALLDAEVEFRRMDVLQPQQWNVLPELDLIISNPPYIPPEEKESMPNRVVDYEPGVALFTPEGDPLLFYRALARLGKKKLKPGGRLYVEFNEFRTGEVVQLFEEAGYEKIQVHRDLQGKDRMLRAILPAG